MWCRTNGNEGDKNMKRKYQRVWSECVCSTSSHSSSKCPELWIQPEPPAVALMKGLEWSSYSLPAEFRPTANTKWSFWQAKKIKMLLRCNAALQTVVRSGSWNDYFSVFSFCSSKNEVHVYEWDFYLRVFCLIGHEHFACIRTRVVTLTRGGWEISNVLNFMDSEIRVVLCWRLSSFVYTCCCSVSKVTVESQRFTLRWSYVVSLSVYLSYYLCWSSAFILKKKHS